MQQFDALNNSFMNFVTTMTFLTMRKRNRLKKVSTTINDF